MILANDPSSNFTESGAERLLVHEVEAFGVRYLGAGKAVTRAGQECVRKRTRQRRTTQLIHIVCKVKQSSIRIKKGLVEREILLFFGITIEFLRFRLKPVF